jgi:N-acetylmuramoyl-L-alanine amidase
MIWISAGHCFTGKIKSGPNRNYDPGAVNSKGLTEGQLTIEFRDLVCKELDKLNAIYKTDFDQETLSQYLKRLTSKSSDLIIEYHFDASSNSSATGTTGLIEGEADRLDRLFAAELTNATALTLAIKNRGVISETESHRGRLGLMREEGLICLVELCFLSNDEDLRKYHENKLILAKEHARIIKKYEDLIT